MSEATIGIIGGSGLYQMPELQNVREQKVETPFGDPSDAFIIGELEGVTVAFLPRHGRGHRLTPTELPFRANIYAMKLLGVEYILSVSAVGSLQEQYAPTDMVIPDLGNGMTQAVNLGIPALKHVRGLKKHLVPIVREITGVGAEKKGLMRRLFGR